jgi:hypothetical protein
MAFSYRSDVLLASNVIDPAGNGFGGAGANAVHVSVQSQA